MARFPRRMRRVPPRFPRLTVDAPAEPLRRMRKGDRVTVSGVEFRVVKAYRTGTPGFEKVDLEPIGEQA